MGNTSNKPITKKATAKGKNDELNGVRWGVSSMQGWRIHMEDGHIAEEITKVHDPESGDVITLDETHYFLAVLDGHGGSMAAEYTSQHLFQMFISRPEFVRYARHVGQVTQKEQPEQLPKKGHKLQDKNTTKSKSISEVGQSQKRLHKQDGQNAKLLQRAFEDSFVEMDLQLLKEMVHQGSFHLTPDPQSNQSIHDTKSIGKDDWDVEIVDPGLEIDSQEGEMEHEASGTTVTAVLVTPDMIICANVGDSRTIVDAFPLSTDHKPSLPKERQRILDAMGTINFNRVEGELAVSRALGDFDFKGYNHNHIIDANMDLDMKRTLAQHQKVSPFPEVTIHYRSDVDQAIILACDGIWDVMSNIECNELVQILCEQGESDVGLIAEEILDTCLKKGSRDNMTILVGLLPAQEIGMGGGVIKRRKSRMRK